MRILGVDPGTQRTGVGLIDVKDGQQSIVHFEVIRLNPKQSIPQRLYRIFSRLSEVIQEFRPDIACLEDIFYALDVQAVVRIGEARACAILAAAGHQIEVVQYAPTRVKQAISGNGRASKVQVQNMVKHLLGLKEPPPSDAADALAVAICHAHLGIKKWTAKVSV